jgi:hypothetical protein
MPCGSRAMNSSLELTSVLDVILHSACDLLEAGAGSIQLVSEDDRGVLEDAAHHRLVDLVCDRAYDWVTGNHELVLRVVHDRAPAWSPRFVDDLIADRVFLEDLPLTWLAGDGFDVGLTYSSNEDGAEDTRQQIEQHGRCAVRQVDLEDPDRGAEVVPELAHSSAPRHWRGSSRSKACCSACAASPSCGALEAFVPNGDG